MIQLLRSTKEIPKKFSIDLYHIVWYNKSVGIVIKTVNGRKYAYHAYRAGKKVAQRYLGALADAKVSALVDVFRCSRVMPSTHYGLFWDVDPGRININRNANYIIERVLELGKLEAAEWLQRVYPINKILGVLHTSRRLSRKSAIFWLTWFGQ